MSTQQTSVTDQLVAKRRAKEDEIARQLAQSVELPYDEKLENARQDAKDSGIFTILFKKTSNPQTMLVRGVPIRYAMNNPTEDIFSLPLDGANGNLATVQKYEAKGWPIIEAQNIPKKPDNDDIKGVMDHLKTVQNVYKKIYAPVQAEGMERKLASSEQSIHEAVIPGQVARPKGTVEAKVDPKLKAAFEKLSTELENDDGKTEVIADDTGKVIKGR